jgi:hypothetical protein
MADRKDGSRPVHASILPNSAHDRGHDRAHADAHARADAHASTNIHDDGDGHPHSAGRSQTIPDIGHYNQDYMERRAPATGDYIQAGADHHPDSMQGGRLRSQRLENSTKERKRVPSEPSEPPAMGGNRSV